MGRPKRGAAFIECLILTAISIHPSIKNFHTQIVIFIDLKYEQFRQVIHAPKHWTVRNIAP